MKTINELEDYIAKTEEAQLAMMVDIVKEYGNKIPDIIKLIKEKHVENNEKEKAEMVFSTVHRSKGMEYDAVQLVNDFISEEELEILTERSKTDKLNLPKLNEEINLLYVAVTRTKNSIYIPENLLPNEFPKSSQIHLVKSLSKEEKEIAKAKQSDNQESKIEKKYSFEEVRKTHKEAYTPWTENLDDELTVMFCEGVNVRDMANHFGRTKGAIRSRIKKLELEELYG